MDAGVEVAERLDLEVREQALDLLDAAEQHGHDHQRPRALGNSVAEIEPGQPARRRRARPRCAGRRARQARSRGAARAAPRPSPCRRELAGVPRTRTPRRRRAPVSRADAAEVDGGARARAPSGASRPRSAGGTPRRPRDRAGPGRSGGGRRAPRFAPMPCRSAARRALSTARSATRTWASPVRSIGEILDRVAVAVAAGEVHPRIDPRRVAPQDLLDRLTCSTNWLQSSVGAESQAGDGVGHRDLIGGLALVLGAYRLLGSRARACRALSPPRLPRRRRAGRTRASAAGAARRRRFGSGSGRAAVEPSPSSSRAKARPPPGAPPDPREFRPSGSAGSRASASLSMLGKAQSSPIVSGATV